MTLRAPNIYLRLQLVRVAHRLITVCERTLIHDVYHCEVIYHGLSKRTTYVHARKR